MTALFPWFVFAHIAGLVMFAACHGVSMFAAFRMRARPERAQVAPLLELSQLSSGAMYLGLVLLALGGLGAAAAQDLVLSGWVVATTVILVVVLVVMYAVGARFYYGLRDRLAVSGSDPEALGDAELATLLDNHIPDVLAAVGGFGIVAMLWLMILKPI